MSKQLLPSEAAETMSLQELEDLALKHMGDDLHVIRHRGQVEIAREMRAVATSNIADILYEDARGVVRMKPLSELPRHVTAAIKKIKIKRDRVRKKAVVFDENGEIEPQHEDMTGEVVELELWDKNASLDKLMRHYGGYEEDNKQTAQGASANAGADLDTLLSVIGGQGLPQLAAPDLENEEDEILPGEEDI